MWWLLLLISIIAIVAIIFGVRAANKSNEDSPQKHDHDNNKSKGRDRERDHDQNLDKKNDKDIPTPSPKKEEQNKKKKRNRKYYRRKVLPNPVPPPKPEPITHVVQTPMPGEFTDDQLAALDKVRAYIDNFKKLYEEKAQEIIKNKIESVQGLTDNPDNKNHIVERDAIIDKAIRQIWEKNYFQQLQELEYYYSSLANLSSNEWNVDEKLVQYPNFLQFVDEKETLIVSMGEKYTYNEFFIRNKAISIKEKLADDDKRIDDIDSIISNLNGKVDDTEVSLNDFLVEAEENLKKLEKIEREISTDKKEAPKEVKKEIVSYQKNLNKLVKIVETNADKIIEENVNRAIKAKGLPELVEENIKEILVESLKLSALKRLHKASRDSKYNVHGMTDDYKFNLNLWVKGSEFLSLVDQACSKYGYYSNTIKEINKIINEMGILTEKEYAEFDKIISSLPNAVISEDVNYEEFMKKADNTVIRVKRKTAEMKAAKKDLIYVDDFIEKEPSTKKQLKAIRGATNKVYTFIKSSETTYKKEAGKLIPAKIDSIRHIDITKFTRDDRNGHELAIAGVIGESWQEYHNTTKNALVPYVERVQQGLVPIENVEERLSSYITFPEFLDKQDLLITQTSEKYSYYVFFIRDKALSLIETMEKNDERIVDVVANARNIESKVFDKSESLNDFLDEAERVLQQLESIDKTLFSKKDLKQRNVQKSLVEYQKQITGGKNSNGTPVIDLIPKKIDSVILTQGISVDPEQKAFMVKKIVGSWDAKSKAASEKVEELIEKVKGSKDSQEILEQKPTLDMDKWLNGSELIIEVTDIAEKIVCFAKYKNDFEKLCSKVSLSEEQQLYFSDALKELGRRAASNDVTLKEFVDLGNSVLAAAHKKIEEIQKEKEQTEETQESVFINQDSQSR